MARFPQASAEESADFFAAVDADDTAAVRCLFRAGLRPTAWVAHPDWASETSDEGAMGLLHVAAADAAPSVVRLLLHKGLPVDQRLGGTDWPTSLHAAALSARRWRGARAERGAEAVKALLKAGASPDALWSRETPTCPLVLCIGVGNAVSILAVARALLAAGARVDGKPGTDWPLHCALAANEPVLAFELLAQGLDPRMWKMRGTRADREGGVPPVCAAVPNGANATGPAVALFWALLLRYTGEPDHPDLRELDDYLERAPATLAGDVKKWREEQRRALARQSA